MIKVNKNAYKHAHMHCSAWYHQVNTETACYQTLPDSLIISRWVFLIALTTC